MGQIVDDLIGARFGHLRIVDHLGEGGVGSVYVGVHEKLGRRVALKALRDRHRLDPEARARFLREAQILSQLSHPNICQIHDYVEGEDIDLLVLELVEGKNLREALRDGLGDKQKLDAAEQLLAALAAAHGRGIVHRDLKPENVMITPGGQVKVLDFGLARTMDEVTRTLAQPRLPTEIYEEAGSAFRTRMGLVTGTVDYMSPEQARGERSSPSSDMFSLGLVFQELFTGRAPDSSGPLPSRLERAQRGDSAPVEGVDPDLAALIERMKARTSGSRPSAIDALDRLRWIRGKRRRRLRLASLAAAGTLLVVLSVALAWQASRAAEAARRAESAWSEAENLSAFMLEDLIDRLRPLGRLDLLDRVAEETQRYYAGVPADLRSPERRYRQGLALRNLGQVLELEGEWTEAEATYREALAIAEGLSTAAPEDALYRDNLRRSWDDLGDVLLSRGEVEEAQAAFQHALALSQGLVEADPQNPARRQALSDAWDDMGGLYQVRGDLEAAMTAYRQSLAEGRRLTAWDRANAEWRSSLARSYHRIGTVHEQKDDLAAARAAFEEALAIDREIVESRPDDSEHLMNLSQALYDAARVQLAQGHAQPAFARLDEALAIDRRLHAQDPANARWRDSLGRGYLALGDALARSGRQAEARSAWREAREVLAPLSMTAAGAAYRDHYREVVRRLADEGA